MKHVIYDIIENLNIEYFTNKKLVRETAIISGI